MKLIKDSMKLINIELLINQHEINYILYETNLQETISNYQTNKCETILTCQTN